MKAIRISKGLARLVVLLVCSLILILNIRKCMADKAITSNADDAAALVQQNDDSNVATSQRISEAKANVKTIEKASEKAEWWSGLWAFVGVVTAVIAALAGAAAYWQASKENNINEKLRKADQNLGDLKLEEERKRIAKANLQIEDRKRENLELQLVVESERTERLKIERTLAPRVTLLTNEVKLKIRTAMEGIPGKSIQMTSIGNDGETRMFASELARLLSDIGCLASHGDNNIRIPPPVGIHMACSVKSPQIKEFARILNDAGISIQLIQRPSTPLAASNTTTILDIGVKQ